MMAARITRTLLVLVLTLLAVIPLTTRTAGTTTASAVASRLAVPYPLKGARAAMGANPAVDYPTAILADNPVSYWQLNELSGTVAHDQRGSSNATINGGVTLGQPGAVPGGNSMAFDGSTGYIEAPDASSLDTLSTAVTIEAWAKPGSRSFGGEQKPLLVKDFTSHSPPYYQYGLFMTDNSILANNVSFYLSIGGHFATLDVQHSGWQYDTWNHIVGIYDGTQMSVYVNGVLKGSQAQSGLLDHYATPIDIGAYAFVAKTAQYLFGGGLAEVALYDHALSAAQVAAHYQAATSSSPAPYVLGLGDSVAAGYGLGPARGLANDNAQAYPALLAARLGMTYHNFAVAGACAAPGDGSVPGTQQAPYTCWNPYFHDLSAQIQDAAKAASSSGRRPTVITLMIGTDDILFDTCFKAALTGSANDLSADPCAVTNLNQNLASFTTSLTADLQALNGDFPGVPILIPEYYNPLPLTAPGNQAPCAVENFLPTLILSGQQHGWVPTVLAYFIVHDKFVGAERNMQTALYQRAQYILGHLTAAAASAAQAARDVTLVPVDFTGHDVCQSGNTPWVFGPTLHASLEFDVGPFISHRFTLDVGPIPFACPAPDPILEPPLQKFIPFGPLVKGGRGRQAGALTYSFLTNCLLHPTPDGQAAIAAAVAKQYHG